MQLISIKILLIMLALPLILSIVNGQEGCTWKSQKKYNEACAKQAALYSFIAYDSDLKSVNEWECELCKQAPALRILGILYGRPGNHYGYIGYQEGSPEVLILSFRGSTWTDFDSVFDDLSFLPTDWPANSTDSKVHHGFYRYYSKIKTPIRDIVTKRLLVISDTKLVITGHSLGGAAAIIASVDLSDIIPNPVVYTFGAPRVGNSFFVQCINDLDLSIFRVVHDHDIVSQLPPCSLHFAQRPCPGGKYPTHPPTEIFYDDEMASYVECSHQNGEDDTCSDSFPISSYSIEDHLVYFGYKFSGFGQPTSASNSKRSGSLSYYEMISDT